MTRNTDPIAILEATRPAAPIDPAGVERARLRVQAEIRASARNDAANRAETTRRGRGRFWALAAGIAAAGAAAAVIIPLGATPPASAAPPMLSYDADLTTVVDGTAPAGNDVAHSLADAARTGHAPGPTSDISLARYSSWKVDVVWREDGESFDWVTVPEEHFSWSDASDGSGLMRSVDGTTLDLNGTAALPEIDAQPNQPAIEEYVREAGGGWSEWVPSLPTDSAELLAEISTQWRYPHGCDITGPVGPPECGFEALSAFWKWGPLPADVTAAFWDAIAASEEIYSLGETADRFGRTGVTLAYVPRDVESAVRVYVADPTTGALLGFEDIDLGSGPASPVPGEPTLMYAEAYQPLSWVSAVGSYE